VPTCVNPEIESGATLRPPERLSASPRGNPSGLNQTIEAFFESHRNPIAFTILAAGLAARIFAASGTYLNPDEVIQYLVADQDSLASAYKASLTNAHPPLHIFLLHVFLMLGHSEFVLRLPSVLAGTAFCWAAFHWIRLTFGRAAGWAGLVFAAFTPALIDLSAEARSYAMLLLLMGSALFFLERSFQTGSARDVGWFSLLLYLAILSHYSGVFFAICAGVYAIVRIADSQRDKKFVVSWIAGQAGGAVLCAFLYFTHLSRLRTIVPPILQPYQRDMLHWGREDLLSLTQYNTSRMFDFLFEQQHVAQIAMWLFAASVAVLLVRELLPRFRDSHSSHLGILFLLPFVFLWAASLAGAYPYVAGRQTVVVAPFILAGAGFMLAAICRQRILGAVLGALVLVGAANAWAKPLQPYISRENQRRSLMLSAVNQLDAVKWRRIGVAERKRGGVSKRVLRKGREGFCGCSRWRYGAHGEAFHSDFSMTVKGGPLR
jgi:4-amino-4-deoxy-L-arabinose transferase-like glycosyltransferase